jgi:hypothetical protein
VVFQAGHVFIKSFCAQKSRFSNDKKLASRVWFDFSERPNERVVKVKEDGGADSRLAWVWHYITGGAYHSVIFKSLFSLFCEV